MYIFLITIKIIILGHFCANYNLPLKDWNHINNKDIALITGGSNGLGLEIVKALLMKRVTVYVFDVTPPSLVKEDEKLIYIKCDIGNEDELQYQTQRIIQDLNSTHRHISILINNAGIRDNKSLLNLKESRIKSMFNVNIMSQIWILRNVVNNHLEYVQLQDPTARLFVVTVSSILGTLAPKNLSVYAATKAASILLHEAFVQELKEYQNTIRLLLVTTGQLDTGMFKDVIPSKEFFAPIVNHIKLANQIVEYIDIGYSGTLCQPFYANFLPMVRTFPTNLQEFCRRISEMDEKIKDS